MKNIASMMKQAQALQERMGKLQEELAQREAEGQAGGGMVKVTLDGKYNLKRLVIDPSLIEAKDQEMIEDLVLAAHADARGKVETLMSEEMAKLTSGLGLPGGLPGGLKLPF